METIINLTKYPINLYPTDGVHKVIATSGSIARTDVIQVPEGEVAGVPTFSHEFGETVIYDKALNVTHPFPDEIPGTFYVVPRIVLDALCDERDDLLSLDISNNAMVYDSHTGKAIGTRSFFRYAPIQTEE